MTKQIPDKLHFKIGEVSKIASVAPHVLRYWESEFSAIQPKRMGSKQRLYRRADVELILTIKQLLHEQGYTIAGARKLLAENTSSEPLANSLTEMPQPAEFDKQLGSIKQELLALKKILAKKN
ncbi:MerR family transcriptional regulator [Desulfofustis glycolicus]|uniref:Transcriptional regulator, MerR family n=1 Tax=Desulfofustis glycolicus DSM 9705 TaxID=1121409 RepID=A0A1M5YJK2_9BACT|nr:MerR family transcriptional regulator [Desulfofustis glycolicus]MCB2217970.1 MerR family transcriptional regulator [Desulfobulbaceae bacterium]SHI12185.1 transcriptional regulator, MerR family [Desulfofustis glycolicus DSM 9705]